MSADMEGRATNQVHGAQHRGVIMSAIHAAQRVVIDGLDAQFQRYKSPRGEVRDHADLVFVHAVGAGADGESDDVRMIDGFGVESAQILGFRVCVRERLEINDEFVRVKPLADVLDAFANLMTDGIGLNRRRRSK